MPEQQEPYVEVLWVGGEAERAFGDFDWVVGRHDNKLCIFRVNRGAGPEEVQMTFREEVSRRQEWVSKEHMLYSSSTMRNVPKKYLEEIEQQIALESL